MRFRRITCALAALALAPVAVACGSGDDGPQSELEVDKLVSELDEEEVGTLCAELNDSYEAIEIESFTRGLCTVQGVLMAELGTISGDAVSCEDERDSCLAFANEAAAAQEVAGPECDAEFQAFAEGCQITVGELQQCIREQVDQFIAMADGVTCQSTLDEIANSIQPTSCDQVLANCPLPDDMELPDFGEGL